MDFKGNNKFQNFLEKSARFGYSNKKLPKLVERPFKFTQCNNNNNNEKKGTKNNLNKTININGANNKIIQSLKNKSKKKNQSDIFNIGKKNDKMSLLNTQNKSITTTDSEISFNSGILNLTNRNNSFIQSAKKKNNNLKIEGSIPNIHNSQSISKKRDKDLNYTGTNLYKINNQELNEINKYFTTKEKESKLKQNPKLDPIDRIKINKSNEIKNNTIKKEDNPMMNGANDEIKKEKEIKYDQSEICGKYNNNLKKETKIKLNENNINEITDNLIKGPEPKPNQNSINDVKNIKKDIEIKPENNPIIGNINIKTEKEKEKETETEIKLYQNYFCHNNNNKTGAGIKFGQNNIGNNNNNKTDTGIMLDQNYFDNNNNNKKLTLVLCLTKIILIIKIIIIKLTLVLCLTKIRLVLMMKKNLRQRLNLMKLLKSIRIKMIITT